jgi:parvulin-like peptidyl-prolyl isomerase
MRFFQQIRARISAWYQAADKSVLTNVAFLVAISLSALLLVSVTAYGWWSDNLAPAVTVNGRSINVSDVRARGEITLFRIGLEQQRIRARVSAGTLSSEAGNAQLEALQAQVDEINNQLTSEVIDALLIAQITEERGIRVEESVMDEAWKAETSLPELRLLRRITIDFTPSEDGSAEAAAKAKAEGILQELEAGAAFSDLAKRESTDSFAEEGGRIGWSSKDEDPLEDLGYAAAWSLETSGPTDAILRSTDQYVIFYVDQIREGTDDPDFEKRAADAEINLTLYREIVGERALSDALGEVITKELTTGPQELRDVSYVTVPVSTSGGEADEVQVRHILYSPNDDAQAAASLDRADPAWAAAKAEADAALAALRANPFKFKKIAEESDDETSAADGGLLRWAVKGTYTKAFDEAVWSPGLTVGEILDVVETEFGFHIIQYAGVRTGIKLQFGALAETLKTATDFIATAKELTKDFDGVEVSNAGFVARYSINPELSAIIWRLSAGEVSGVSALGESLVIVKVDAIETKTLAADQLETLTENGYFVWLEVQRRSVEIAIDGQVVQEASGLDTP